MTGQMTVVTFPLLFPHPLFYGLKEAKQVIDVVCQESEQK